MYQDLAAFIHQIQQGGCGIYPTDTVPGLGALPLFAEQIYRIKQRNIHKPLILLAATLADIQPFCAGWEADWQELMAQCWPGALTLVLPAAPQVPPLMQQAGYVGVRIPNHPVALELLAQTGPLATTSINRSGEPALIDPVAIQQAFPQIPLLAGHYPTQGIPSTIIRWQETSKTWEVLRQGAVRP